MSEVTREFAKKIVELWPLTPAATRSAWIERTIDIIIDDAVKAEQEACADIVATEQLRADDFCNQLRARGISEEPMVSAKATLAHVADAIHARNTESGDSQREGGG